MRPARSRMRIGESAPMIAAFATVVSFTAVKLREMSIANSAPPGAHALKVAHDSRRRSTASASRWTATPSHSRYIANVSPVIEVVLTNPPTLPHNTVVTETATTAVLRWGEGPVTGVAYGTATRPN